MGISGAGVLNEADALAGRLASRPLAWEISLLGRVIEAIAGTGPGVPLPSPTGVVGTVTALRTGRAQLIPALEALTSDFTRQTGIDVDLRTPGPSLPPVAPPTAAAIYWAAAEALNSVERGARATGVVVTLRAEQDLLELVIRDDGVGLVARQGPGGRPSPLFGLRSMARGLEAVGGRLRVMRAEPRGLLIRGSIPLSSDLR